MVAAFVLGILLAAAAQGQPVPQPFPRPGGPPVQAPAPRPAQPPAPTQPLPAPRAAAPASAGGDSGPTEAMLGVPLYPGLQFIASYDAGRDQRYYLFGSAGSFVDLVAYYRTVLKQKGDLVIDIHATHEFDVGKFDDKTMAFPPGVTIKDFQSDLSPGFPNPKPGAEPARFPTVVQIVPVPGK
jgi:hypothetical protein